MTTSKITPARQWKRGAAFTLVELLGVIVVIGILAGITLGAAGAVRRQAAVGQARAEVTALEGACTSFFTQNGFYPSSTSANPTSAFNPAVPNSPYQAAGQTLFTSLFGTNQFDRPPATKRYFEPKPSMVSSTNTANPYFVDPWGYAYGYYSDGTNAPLIWSTASQTTQTGTNRWITSWPRN
jgi:type II secretory pathway pseudopilin PulG